MGSNHNTSLPLKLFSHPYRESKVQSEVRVPKVILAGRCSKSSAVTGTVVVRAVRGRGGISLNPTVELEGNIPWVYKIQGIAALRTNLFSIFDNNVMPDVSLTA